MATIADALLAGGPAADAPALATFGRLVGSWQVENRFRRDPDAEWVHSSRTWIFSWILDGRAVQDVLIGSDRGDEPVVGGTTVRAYDPAIDAWRVQWFGPLHGTFVSLIARAHGDDGIRQDGVEHTTAGDIPVRWNFSAITPDAFAWDGWSSADGGATWWLEQHMDARRIAA